MRWAYAMCKARQRRQGRYGKESRKQIYEAKGEEMIILGFPALVMIVGIVAYYICARPESKEVGRIMFFCGLLALCLQGEQFVKLLNH